MVARFFALSDNIGTFSPFLRRKPVKLTHSGALTDHQHYETFDYEPAMLNNFDDIRFTTQSGEHIPYWIETKTDGVSAKVWFMNDYVDGDTYIWMYYGSGGLSSGSSGNDTFIQWHGAETSNFIDSLDITAGALVYEGKIKITTDNTYLAAGVSNLQNPLIDDSMIFIFTYDNNKRYIRTYNEGSVTLKEEVLDISTDVFYHAKIINTGTNVWGFLDDNRIDSGDITTNLPNEDMGLVLYNLGTGTVAQDWSFARKYTAAEPTGIVGAEQHPRDRSMIIS